MACSDPLILQRFLDGDLDPSHAELVAVHLHSCDGCRAEARRAAELRALVQDHLGAEDEGEEEATAAAVAAIGRRILPPHLPRTESVRWWRRTWMATAALIVIALLVVPVVFLSDLDASPAELLEDAAERNRIWMYQPNKLLHWEVDTVSHGVRKIADGRWRTMFWRKNGATHFAEASRQIGPDGALQFAAWQNADGSTAMYRSTTGVLEIAPSASTIRNEIPRLSGDLRSALQSHLTSRSLNRSLKVERLREMERVHGRSVWTSGGKATFSRGAFDRWGDVHHITVVKDEGLRPDILRVVHEYDIDSASLRLLRLKTTITYRDGSQGVHDSRWTAYREITPEEFAAQTPDDLLASGIPVVRLTPSDLAQRIKKENATR